MAVTVESFRAEYPEFSDAAAYPTPSLQASIVLAGKMMDAARWGDLLDHGTSLIVAHRAVRQRRASVDARFGKVPGMASGPVASKGVDKVNMSFDTGAVNEEGAGHWNLTTYGQEYIRLARMIGAGPVHVGAPDPNSSAPTGHFYAGPFLG